MINRINGFYGNSYGCQSQSPQRQDPDTYAQTYAKDNNISFEEAKNQLRAKYGDPELTNVSMGNQNLNFAGIDFSEDVLKQEDEDVSGLSFGGDFLDKLKQFGGAVMNFVSAGNKTETENETKNNQNPNGLKSEEQRLLDLGVPLFVIQQGDDAIMNFIQDNNITDYIPKQDINPFGTSFLDTQNAQLNTENNESNRYLNSFGFNSYEQNVPEFMKSFDEKNPFWS